jgi:hypothetical protein
MQLDLLAVVRAPKAASPVAREAKRRASNKQRVLERLQQGPATTMELIAVGGARAIGRTWELRRQGYAMRIEDAGDGLFRYSLISPTSHG